MTNSNQNLPRRFRSTLTRGLLILSFGVALAAAVQPVARAQPMAPAPSCSVALDQLMATWRSVAFAEPAKPTQMVVAGRHGYTTTGGQFNFMRQEIGAGARECQAGHDAAALQHIDTVRTALEHSHNT
jgi:hypothetical protein